MFICIKRLQLLAILTLLKFVVFVQDRCIYGYW